MKPSSNDAERFAKVEAAIAASGHAIATLPGVVEVWAGYKFRKGKLTNTPAIIVSVLRKETAANLSPKHKLPASVNGVPVDVVPASPLQLVRFAATHGPATAASNALELAGMVEAAQAPQPLAAATAATVPRVPYKPSQPPLREVKEKMTMICHASPDAGFRVLADFFQRTKNRLTATMYEFTAKHVLKELQSALTMPHKLAFIMDSGNEANEQARAALKKSLGTRMKFAWAAVADSTKVKKAFFPTAYHIKVAVRDGREFWLSSGNWKDSNQPLIDPINNPFPTPAKADAFHRKQNRDWHVVVDNLALAAQFERFIRHDISQATPLQKTTAAPTLAMRLATIPQEFFVAEAIPEKGGVKFFPEQEFDKELRVMPLLTPDNYADAVLPLIQGATKSILFQNQSLSASVSAPKYKLLLETLRDKTQDDKVQVKIIVRGDFDPHKILSGLKKSGFNMNCVKLMNGNHNKGILIDDKITVIGSHNWTGQGTTENRDASLIIHDAEVTAYFTQLFRHDWLRRSGLTAPVTPALASVATARAEAPSGMARLTARDILDGAPPDLF